MPAAGDQHKSSGGASANPFDEEQPRISEYTAQDIATLQSRLDKRLGPEYISSRPGAAGQRVHYLAAEKVINLANEVFGFNGWSSAIKAITIDFIDENQHTGKISLGLSVIIRVTLRDGTYHEDIGYGQIENCKGKAAAFEKAKKEGTTDGLKRALRTFGNVLGNCIYDKDFLGKVTKIKVAPSRWDADNLHRHPDFVPAKREQSQHYKSRKTSDEDGNTSPTEVEDEFGAIDFSHADFSESHTDHPDEVTLPVEAPFPMPPAMPVSGGSLEQPKVTAPSASGALTTSWPHPQTRTVGPPNENRAQGPSLAPRNPSHDQRPLPGQQPNNIKANSNAAVPKTPQGAKANHLPSLGQNMQQHGPPPPIQAQPQQHNPAPPHNQPSAAPIGFFSARAAPALNEASDSAAPPPVSQFNPHSQSPSIRKTIGIDHSRSVPVKKAAMGVVEPAVTTTPLSRENTPAPPAIQAPSRDFVNPSSDAYRKIGAPAGGGGGGSSGINGMPSPIAKAGGMNGSAYRPPTRRGPTTDAHSNPNPNLNSNPGAGVIAGSSGQPSIGPGHNGSGIGVKRPPLSDISNNGQGQRADGPAVAATAGDDPKRPRTTGPENTTLPPQPL